MDRYHFRRLELEDHGAVVTLHNLLHQANQRPEAFRRDKPERLLANLKERGTTFGAFLGDDLVAYASVALGGPAADEVIRQLKSVVLATESTAVHDGSGVHPDHRGNDLQDKLNVLRLEEAFRHGCEDIVGTVSPLNPYSLKNHFDFDFVVRGFGLFYGALPRIVVHRARSPRLFPEPNHEVRLEAVHEVAPLFEQGCVGVSLEWREKVAWLQIASGLA